MVKISPKEIFRNLPIFFKILIFIVTVIGSLLIILTLYINLKELQRDNDSFKTWNNESEIPLKYSGKPQLSLSWELGCEENDTDCDKSFLPSKPNTKIIVYAEYNDFIEVLKSKISYDPIKNDPKNKIIFDLLKKLSSQNSEVILDNYEEEIKNIDSENNTMFSSLIKDIKTELLEQAKVAIYDIQNNQFVEYIKIEENGSSCGSDCENITKIYKLPNEKIFEISGWTL